MEQQYIKTKMINQLVSEVAFIIVFSVFIAVAVNGFRAGGIRLFDRYTELEKNEIDIEDGVRLYNKGIALFVDARSFDEYIDGHIKGALNLPLYEFDDKIIELAPRVDPEMYIITYCDGINCDLASILAQKLIDMEFNNVYFIKNGFTRWKERSLPIEKTEEKMINSE